MHARACAYLAVAARSVSISLRICCRRDGSEMQISLTAIERPEGRCSARRTNPRCATADDLERLQLVKINAGRRMMRLVGRRRRCVLMARRRQLRPPSRPISKPPILNLPDSVRMEGDEPLDESPPVEESSRLMLSAHGTGRPRMRWTDGGSSDFLSSIDERALSVGSRMWRRCSPQREKRHVANSKPSPHPPWSSPPPALQL